MTKIFKATTKQHFKDIENLANTIWREHYTPIIGIEQVEYMLKKFQSAEAMYSQFMEGFHYYMIYMNNQLVGYFSYIKQDHSLYLSKIYIAKDYRGQKIGKKAMVFVTHKALENHCKSVSLGVNKYNIKSIAAYEALGFTKVGAMVTDIGNGFVMDDYKMEKHL